MGCSSTSGSSVSGSDRRRISRTSGGGSARHSLFRHVRVFDGEQVLDADCVRVAGERIVDVGTHLSAPPDAEVIEGDGGVRTLLPGLIDGHLHVVSRDVLEHLLVFGVTTALDMYMDVDLLAELREGSGRDAGRPSADFLSAGALITAPGGHGTEYGLPVGVLDGPGEAPELVDELVAAGSDYIKIVYDDGAQYGLSFPTLGLETVSALVDAAHRRDRLVIAHIGTRDGARAVIEAGVDGLAHVFLDRMPEPGFGEFVARHGVFVSPTLSSLMGVTGQAPGAELADDERLEPWLSKRSRMNLRHAYPTPSGDRVSYEVAEAAVRQLEAAAVPLLAGSDVPNPGTAYGVTTHGELELLVEAGLSPLQALAAATSTPADLFGLSDRGRIRPGGVADLLLVEGDPTTEIAATRSILGVWKNGVPVERRVSEQPVPREGERLRGEETTAPAPGLVSDFDDGTPASAFGSGWAVSTDGIIGGASTARFEVVEGGAERTPACLEIEGTIRTGAPFPWAGAIFYPGDAPLEPADLSRARALTFWARGRGERHRVILFSHALGMVPMIQEFRAPRRWRHHRFELSSFSGVDGHDITGVLFAGGAHEGPFRFWIDEVRFV